MSLLTARGVTFEVDDRRLVDGVDLDLEPGSLLAVVGPNGAGKSTLLRLLSGELPASSGAIELAGADVGTMTPVDLARQRAVLPQQTVIQFAFRCLDIVLMGRFMASDERDLEVARDSMARTDTSHLAERTFPTLSGGEQTRVSLARVLAQETPALFLDEPTGSLDLRHQEMVMATLRGLVARGAGVLAVLHDLNLAARFADRAVLLHEGRVHASGLIRDVLTEEAIGLTYGHPVQVVEHPVLDCPLIVPVPSR
jgi:iron complex transport system ATP-binding protein